MKGHGLAFLPYSREVNPAPTLIPAIFGFCGQATHRCCFAHRIRTFAGIIMWERACSRWHHRGLPDRPQRLHRRQACSHRVCAAHKIRTLPGSLCGSELARDGITAVCLTDRSACIAGKPAPTSSSPPTFVFTPARKSLLYPGLHQYTWSPGRSGPVSAATHGWPWWQ